MSKKFERYNLEQAEKEAVKLHEKISEGKATTYAEAETLVESEIAFEKRIENMEKSMFSEFVDSQIYSPKDVNYFYFSPSHHVRTGLLTQSDIVDFKSNEFKKILSVGSGPAYLERLLVKLGIHQDNIILADVNAIHLPKNFKNKIFDMYEDWPEFGDEKFDLIIFPESAIFGKIGDIDPEKEHQKFQETLYKLISFAFKNLVVGGEIRINGPLNTWKKPHSYFISQIPIDLVIDDLRAEGHTVTMDYHDRSAASSLLTIKKGVENLEDIQEREIYWDDQLREIKNTKVPLHDYLNQIIPLGLYLQDGHAFIIKNFREVYSHYLSENQLNHPFLKKLSDVSMEINGIVARGGKQINKNARMDIFKIKEEDLEFLRKNNYLINDLIHNYYRGPTKQG